MKIQVVGHRGMLGSSVTRAVQARGHDLAVRDLNIETVMVGQIDAPTVINCAGLVKQRQYPASRFMAVNAVGPHRLAEACDLVGARLIHVSTDCVFQGPGPHDEWDAVDCEDEYARSKFAGEVYRQPHLTIRTSFVGFGTRGLIAALQSREPQRASDRLLWSGHTVDAVADVLVTLAERPDVIGLLHIPGEFQSRYELCVKLATYLMCGAQVIRDDTFVADRRLVSIRWQALGLPELPSFDQQLEVMRHP